jgi:hypothetical protein
VGDLIFLFEDQHREEHWFDQQWVDRGSFTSNEGKNMIEVEFNIWDPSNEEEPASVRTEFMTVLPRVGDEIILTSPMFGPLERDLRSSVGDSEAFIVDSVRWIESGKKLVPEVLLRYAFPTGQRLKCVCDDSHCWRKGEVDPVRYPPEDAYRNNCDWCGLHIPEERETRRNVPASSPPDSKRHSDADELALRKEGN